jgi:cyclase
VGRKIGLVLGVVVALVGIFILFVYDQITSLESEPVTDDVHVIFGLGGNVGVLSTSEGTVVVDTMTFPLQGRRIRELAERLGGGATAALVNTHYHGDHTHGNPAWAVGTRVVATERTNLYLDHFDADFWAGDAAGTRPNETFDGSHVMRIGDKTIRSYQVGPAHTGGDLVVLFVEDRVLHTGDLVFNGFYPNIDLEAGGSVAQWSAALDRVLALDFERVIPGHGPVTDRGGVERFQRFVRDLARVGAEAAAAGKTLEQTLDEADLRADAGFEAMSIPFVLNLDRNFVLRRAWEEANGVVSAVALPAPDPAR